MYSANKVVEGSRPDIAVTIARANYGLNIGTFELDMDDGELSYQAALPFHPDMPVDQVLDRIVYVGISTMNRYLPAFMSVIYENEPTREAIALVEQA